MICNETTIFSREGVASTEFEECTLINTTKSKEENPSNAPKSATCNMCQAAFSSKSKLFEHLAETGHAIKKEYAPKKNTNKNKGGVNKKGKKGRKC